MSEATLTDERRSEIEQELARCERNMMTIVGDKELVILDETLASYDKAALAQRDQLCRSRRTCPCRRS